MSCEVLYYETERGEQPVADFLLSLPKGLRAKAMRDIDLLEEFGRDFRYPQVDTIKGDRYKGLYELRSKFSSDITRIYYFFMQGDKIILLHGILKKSAKPPQRDLDTAKARMKDMKERGL